jgi:hypothetical protein
MFFPEFLYRLSQRDQQVTWLDPVVSFQQDAQLAVNVSVTFTVPDARALVLQHASIVASPSGAQTSTLREIVLRVPGVGTTNSGFLKREETTGAGGQDFFLDWQGSAIIPPQWRIIANGTFVGVATANTVNLTVLGILIPIGNIQRV